MPLHLLGKKSWNVYNADNIARVRRDEAAAQAAEEAEEQRMQEVDAQRRLSILRGAIPPPLPETEEKAPVVQAVERREARGGQRKRKRQGEDDTDFELRIANERYESRPDEAADLKHKTSSAPITDNAGHIDLFGDERARGRAEGNEEAEREAKKKKQEFEDQYTMRFANAAGREGVQKPWYSNAGDGGTDGPLKNVWGKDDHQRRERDAQRTVSNDPLAMMKLGASKARHVNQERKRVQEERDAELRRLRREQEHAERRRRRRRERSSRSPSPNSGDRHHEGRSHKTSRDHDSSSRHRRHHHDRQHRHHRRHRSRSPREGSTRARSREEDDARRRSRG